MLTEHKILNNQYRKFTKAKKWNDLRIKLVVFEVGIEYGVYC
jgi:hypothetical protein